MHLHIDMLSTLNIHIALLNHLLHAVTNYVDLSHDVLHTHCEVVLAVGLLGCSVGPRHQWITLVNVVVMIERDEIGPLTGMHWMLQGYSVAGGLVDALHDGLTN